MAEKENIVTCTHFSRTKCHNLPGETESEKQILRATRLKNVAPEKSGDFRGKTILCNAVLIHYPIPSLGGFFKKGQINICKSSLFELDIDRTENMSFDIKPVSGLKLPPVLVQGGPGASKALGDPAAALPYDTGEAGFG